jgi:hypothetical protein
VKARLALVDQAGTSVAGAKAALRRWPLGTLGALPLAGRDLRVASAVTDAAGGTVTATRTLLVTGLGPMERGPDARNLDRAATALTGLAATLEAGVGRVGRAEPLLLTRGARAEFLDQGRQAAGTARAAGAGLRLAATMYGPAGSARWFLGFQNPAELRGTGGLLGQYGILESSPAGPRLTHVGAYEELDRAVRKPLPLTGELAARYTRFGTGRTWSAVNIPPDLPSVARTMSRFELAGTGRRLDGVVVLDPEAVAAVLAVAGPVTVDGTRLDARNVVGETLVEAYVRYADDNPRRKRFLEGVARETFDAARTTLKTAPLELLRGLGTAAAARHVQVWSADPGAAAGLARLGIDGSAHAPAEGDYLMPVGVNANGTKLDAFLHRTVRWDVRLAADGSAKADASVTLANRVPNRPLPRYIVGPYDRRYTARVQRQWQTLYVAGGYSFDRVTLDRRPAGAEALPELGATALSRYLEAKPGRSTTLAFGLTRDQGAATVVGGRLRYRLLVRPQAVVNPDRAELTVRPPAGWRPATLPGGWRAAADGLHWSGALTSEQRLEFWFAPIDQ